MKKLLVCMLFVMPVMASADVANWEQIGEWDNKDNRMVYYSVNTVILDNGKECTTLVTYFRDGGMLSTGGGISCNEQLYNCLYHGIGCGSGGTEIHNGADINIDNTGRGKR